MERTMFVLLLMFFPVSLSQVPTTHYTQHLTLLIHTCRLHTHGVSRKVRRGLSHLLKARCLRRACRKNQTVIFVLPLSASSPTPGIVWEENSVQAKKLTENKTPIIKILDNNAWMPVIKQENVRNYHILLIFARLIGIIINNAFVMKG